MKSTLNKWIKISFVVFSFAIFLLSANNALASKTDNVFGWMWSDNIGWISLNNCSDPVTCSGPDYGVKIDHKNNNVTGTAWSSNVGWISFNSWDWADCPPTSCTQYNNFGKGGWARALNGIYTPHPTDGRDNRGGFDGWISLGGSNPTYGLIIDTKTDVSAKLTSGFKNMVVNPIEGYAWGSNVIGWVQAGSSVHGAYVIANDPPCNPATDPSCAITDKKTFEITANTSIVSGDTVDIYWEAKKSFYPVECTGSMGGTNSPFPDSSWTTKQQNSMSYPNNVWNTSQKGVYTSIHVPPNTQTTFQLSCTDTVDTYVDTIDITATLTASISPVSNSCIETTDPNPKFEWNTNDSSPDCVVEVSPFYGKFSPYTIPSIGSLKPSGKGPFNLTDTNFQYSDNAFYKLTCKNGSGPYEVSNSPVTTFVKMCSNTSDYVITNDGQVCNYVTEVKNSSPKIYQSQKVALSLIPNKFTADADVSLDTSRNTPVGKFNFSPSVFKYLGSKYNTVDTEWSLTSTELSKIINSTSFNGKNIQSIDVGVVGQSQNTTPKRETLYYCVQVPPKCSANSTDPDCIKAQCDPKVDPGCTPCDSAVDPFCIPTQTVKPKYKPF